MMYWNTSIINSNFDALYLGGNSHSGLIFPGSPNTAGAYNLAIAGKWDLASGTFTWFKSFNDARSNTIVALALNYNETILAMIG